MRQPQACSTKRSGRSRNTKSHTMIQATGANIRTSRPSWKSGRMPTPPRTSPGRLASISCKSTFHSFLHRYMREIGGAHLIPHLREMKRGSWFGNYRELFRRLLDIEWEKSGANIQFLEQVILTRNDFSHNLELGSLTAYQTDEHSKKYPESAFADPRWKRLRSEERRVGKECRSRWSP